MTGGKVSHWASGSRPCKFLPATLDNRGAWPDLCDFHFSPDVTIEAFVSCTVKQIRVLRYLMKSAKTTPAEIQEQVRRVWLGKFWRPHGGMLWAEPTMWNVEAKVEFEDGNQTSLLMDNWVHVRFRIVMGGFGLFG
jgi:hypothetical protein